VLQVVVCSGLRRLTAVPRSRIFILLPPAVTWRRAIQWALGLTSLSADLIAPVALWKAPTVVKCYRFSN
jgi:hypothetical protein